MVDEKRRWHHIAPESNLTCVLFFLRHHGLKPLLGLQVVHGQQWQATVALPKSAFEPPQSWQVLWLLGDDQLNPYLVGGLVAMNLAFSHQYWVANHPNWRTHIFQRGGPGPPTSYEWQDCLVLTLLNPFELCHFWNPFQLISDVGLFHNPSFIQMGGWGHQGPRRWVTCGTLESLCQISFANIISVISVLVIVNMSTLKKKKTVFLFPKIHPTNLGGGGSLGNPAVGSRPWCEILDQMALGWWMCFFFVFNFCILFPKISIRVFCMMMMMMIIIIIITIITIIVLMMMSPLSVFQVPQVPC